MRTYTIFEKDGILSEPISASSVKWTEYDASGWRIEFEGTKKRCLNYIDEL